MSLGNLVAVVFGLAFGGALLMLSPAKAGAAMVGLAAAVTILRFPFWGLLLFALVATFMPYSHGQRGDPFDGQRSDPRPDLGRGALAHLPLAPAAGASAALPLHRSACCCG